MGRHGLIIGLGLALGLGLVGAPVYADDVTFSAEIEDSLSLSLSDDSVVLVLNPETAPFSTGSISAYVSTNNEFGYVMTVSSSSTDLTRTEALADDIVPVIPTLDVLAGGYSQESFIVNHWGYNKGSGNWLSFESLIELGSSDELVDNEQKTMNFAAKVDFTQPAGIYNTTLTFLATANVVTDLSSMQEQTAASMAELLPNVGDTVTMEDSRDGEQYVIGKMADGSYWMLDNLRLGGDEPITLTTADTNLESSFVNGFVLPANNNTNTSDYEHPGIKTERKNTLQVYGTGSNTSKNGVYYNYCAVSVGEQCGHFDEGVSEQMADSVTAYYVQSDICPKGWHVPSEDEEWELSEAYGNTHDTIRNALRIQRNGYYYYSHYSNDDLSFTGYDSEGFIWGSPYAEEYGVKGIYDYYYSGGSWSNSDLRIGGGPEETIGGIGFMKSNNYASVRCAFGPSAVSPFDGAEEYYYYEVMNMMMEDPCVINPWDFPDECGWEPDPEEPEPEE